MLNLTRAQVMSDALERAARPDLTSDARLWLNLFLEHAYHNYDFDWLVKYASISASQGASLPSDYRATKSATLVTSNGLLPLEVFSDSDRYDYLRMQHYNQTAKPKYMWVDLLNSQAQFIPAPESGLTVDLRYYHFPALPDHTDAGTDSQTIVWKLPHEILIKALMTVTLDYNDDDRFDRAYKLLDVEIQKGKMNDHDRRASSSRFKMGKAFKKRF